jgi:signal transduction histidine kinase/DNA-binding response OmpR family regulator
VSSEFDLLKSRTDAVIEHLRHDTEVSWESTLEKEVRGSPSFIGAAVTGRNGVEAQTGPFPLPPDFNGDQCYLNARSGFNHITSTIPADGLGGEYVIFRYCAGMSYDHVLVVTLSGSYFSRVIAPFKIWETGSLFVLDGEGTIVANVREDMVRIRDNAIKNPPKSVDSESVRAFELKAVKGGSGSGTYTIGGKERIAWYLPVSGTERGWIVGASAPISESPGGYLQSAFLILGGVFLGFGVLASGFLTVFVTKQFKTINAQNAKLTELNEVARNASESKTAFLANMSHEMRTPLNAVVGFSELIMNGLFKPEEEEDIVGKIHGAGMSLLGIVNDILDISKIESGKFELVPVDYEVASLINDTVTMNSVRLQDKEIEFRLSISPDIPARLMGDEIRIKQITNNFLSNAFKYTKEGTVELRVGAIVSDPEVWLEIAVSDTGIGIKQEDMGKLFSAYNQLDIRSNRKIEGTGLGLSIAKRMAELMGGSIKVESEHGKGSTFTAMIKQKFVTHDVIGKKVQEELEAFRFVSKKTVVARNIFARDLSYARVLIVDDVQTNLDVAKGMLKPYKMKIDCVTSGRQAIHLIKSEEAKYDAVFMDHMMPELDGIETVKILREEVGTPYAKNIPVIALTDNALTGNEKMFMENGFQAFLSKPINMRDMDAVLERWVRDKEKEKLREKEETLLTRRRLLTPKSRAAESSDRENQDADGADRESRDRDDRGLESASPESGPGTIPGVDVSGGIERFGGSEETYRDCLRSFARNTGPLLDALGDPTPETLDAYVIMVHGLKSSAHGVLANEFGDAARELEARAGEKDLPYVLEKNRGFVDAGRKLVRDISEWLETRPEKGSESVMDRPDPELLAKLARACENYDMDGVDGIMEELGKHSYREDPGLAKWLGERVTLMEFDKIVERFKTPDAPADKGRN